MTDSEPQTSRSRAHFVCSQHVNAVPETVFPLLCPVREYEWLPGWGCELAYTASGIAEEGAVFQTDRPGEGGLDTWVVSRYEPSQKISFVRVNPLRAIQYDIHLAAAPDGSTTLRWEQTITALDEEGDRHVSALREEDFAALIATLEKMLEHFLATGKPLEVAH